MYSVPQIVTRATADNFVLNYQEKSIIQPFKECGFKTFAISADNLICNQAYRYLVKDVTGYSTIMREKMQDLQIL